MAKQLCYRKLQSKNIRNLFVQVCNLELLLYTATWKDRLRPALWVSHVQPIYFEADDVKKHKRENIVPVIDRGMFHNYVHVYKQLFLHDAIRSHCWRSTPLSRVSHLLCKGVEEKGKEWWIKRKTMVQWINLWNSRFVN